MLEIGIIASIETMTAVQRKPSLVWEAVQSFIRRGFVSASPPKAAKMTEFVSVAPVAFVG